MEKEKIKIKCKWCGELFGYPEYLYHLNSELDMYDKQSEAYTSIAREIRKEILEIPQ